MQSIRQYREIGKRVAAQYASKGRSDSSTQGPLPEAGVQADITSPGLEEGLPSSDVSSPTLLPSPSDMEKGLGGADQDAEEAATRLQNANGEHSNEEPAKEEDQQDLKQTQTYRTTVGRAMTGVDVRKATTKEGGGDRQVFVVGFRGENDPLNPHKWSYAKRIWIV